VVGSGFADRSGFANDNAPRMLSEEEKKKTLSLGSDLHKSGQRLPPRIAIAKSCCALYWKR